MAFTDRSKAGQQAELASMRREADKMRAAGLTAAAALRDRAIANREKHAK